MNASLGFSLIVSTSISIISPVFFDRIIESWFNAESLVNTIQLRDSVLPASHSTIEFMRLIVRGNPCLQAGEETHNFLLNRETINEFDILLNFSFLYEIPALTLVPSNLRISNEPEDLLPKMKHSKPSYRTLSSSRNPFTRYGAWFFFLTPPFRVLAL